LIVALVLATAIVVHMFLFAILNLTGTPTLFWWVKLLAWLFFLKKKKEQLEEGINTVEKWTEDGKERNTIKMSCYSDKLAFILEFYGVYWILLGLQFTCNLVMVWLVYFTLISWHSLLMVILAATCKTMPIQGLMRC